MPLPLMPIALGISGIAGILGARNQNQTNEANLRAMQAWRNRIAGMSEEFFSRGPGTGEKQLLEFLNAMGQQPGIADNKSFNTGQDALMQMLRADPVNTDDLFASWEPIESRMLDQSLADAWSGASGIGQRFGSAMMREEGRVRGQAAENNTARRAETSVQLAESNATRQQQIAQMLSQLGLAGEAADNESNQTMLGGLGALLGAEQGRNSQNLGILQLLAGLGTGMQQPSAMPGAFGEIGQLLMMLPFLQNLGKGGN